MEKGQVIEVEINSKYPQLIEKVEKMLTPYRIDTKGRRKLANSEYQRSFHITESGYQALQDEFSNNVNLSMNEVARYPLLEPKEVLEMIRDTSNLGSKTDINFLQNIDQFSAYTPVDDIETILTLIHDRFSSVTQLITDLCVTEEGRKTPVIQIGAPCDSDKNCVLVVGGMHADEWVPTEGLLYYAYAICNAFTTNSNVEFGQFFLGYQEVKSFLENNNLVVIPCLNPDGRAYTQNPNGTINWRKNRSTEHLLHHVDKLDRRIGIDINRNFDIAWDLDKFAPGHVKTSNVEKDETYQGIRPNSEIETLNLVRLFRDFPKCHFYIDVHSSGNLILYPWAIDTNQSHNTDMTEGNEKYNGRRGKKDSDYGEYMPLEDDQQHYNVATKISAAIRKGTGNEYQVIEASELYSNSDQTGQGIAGVSPDYAYSRHLKKQKWGKILGFTLECGTYKGDPYMPPIEEAQDIITEICCALGSVCSELVSKGDNNLS